MPHSSTKASGSKDKRSPEGSTKSLTPQRKHRKLLKDGTSEVWPESIEEIFVEGLRQYWESPWATYSRGRSRWRNQFLVDYLQKAGVERTKKQVASHIQVLRNMWRDEPEFHLVAGGEELSLDTGFIPPAVKAEDNSRTLLSLETDEGSLSPVSPGSSSGYSPMYGRHLSPQSADSPGGSVIQPSLYSSGPLGSPRGLGAAPLTAFGAKKTNNGGSPFAPSPLLSSSSPPPPTTPFVQIPQQIPIPAPSDDLHDLSYDSSSPPPSSPPFRVNSQPQPTINTNFVRSFSDSSNTSSSPLSASSHYSAAPSLWGNRLCYLSLWADGMNPFTIPASGAQQLPSPVTMRIKLRLPSIDDIRSPPTLHGFHGTMTMASHWLSAAECITKVYVNNVCIAQESGSLHPLDLPGLSAAASSSSTVQVFLPESPLSRSRWLDASSPTMITQQIVVDGATLALVIYDLDREGLDGSPSAEVLSIQNLAEQLAPAAVQAPLVPLISSTYRYSGSNYGNSSSSTPFIPPRSRGMDQTSLSCALTPTNGTFAIPPAMTTLLY